MDILRVGTGLWEAGPEENPCDFLKWGRKKGDGRLSKTVSLPLHHRLDVICCVRGKGWSGALREKER